MTEESNQPSAGLIVAIKKRFDGATEPASIEMVADVYAKIGMVLDTVTSLIGFAGTSGETKEKYLAEVRTLMSACTEELANSLARLSAEQAKFKDGG